MPTADDPSKSPSPPPKPPTALTPGARAERFIKLYNNTLDNTLSAISYEAFSSCFPNIAARTPDALKSMHADMVSRLGGFAQNDFEKIMRERNVVENLNRLEDLIADARKRMARGEEAPVPPHTLPPEPLVNAHLKPLLVSQQSQLNAKLQTTQSQNASLIENIRLQKREIEELVSIAEKVVADLEDAGRRLGKEGEVLAAESWKCAGGVE